MKKQIIAASSTHLIRAAFLLILPFLLGPAMHQALGQRNTGKRSVAANLSQVMPPASGAVPAPYAVPAKPAPNIPGIGQSQLPTISSGAATAVGSKPNGVAPAEPSQVTSMWTVATPYPTTIVRYGFAQTATHFYVFGGVSDGSRVNNVNRMDIGTGVWQARAPMPFASEAPTCALMASTGIVYCTEGDTGSGFAAYNIATDTWTPLASIPGGDHYGSASGAFNGKVFVAGGTTGIVNTVQVYNVASNTWSAGTAAPSAFLLAGYQEVGQYLYVVGGFTSSPNGPGNSAELTSVLYKGQRPDVPSANNTTTWRLDMSSAPGVWSVGPAFTEARGDFGLAYDSGTNKLYAMGGDATGGTYFDSTNLVDELSVASWPGGSWTASPDNLILPNRQANQAGFYGAGQIWSVGGIVGQTFQFLAEVQRRTNGGGGGCTPGTWVTKANYPLSVYGAANATDGTYAYVFGGNTIGGVQHAEANRYDPVANSWSPLASMTAGADYLLHGEYGGNGKIYVMGGLNNGTLNRIYTIGTNAWSTGAAVPVAVYDHGHAYSNGKIYVIGGIVGGVAASTVYAYDVGANTWSTRAPLPQAEFNMAAGVIGGKIYVAGGSTGSDFITNLYIYDIAGNSWSAGAPMGTGANYPAGTVVGGKLWVIGGGDPFSAPTSFNNTQIYDPATNTWSNGPVLNQARSFADAVTLNGAGTQSALIVGGYNSTSGTSLNSVEMNTSNCGSGCTQAWRNEPPMANARRNPATTVVGSNLYAITGFTAAPDYTDVNERFDGTSWTTMAPIPVKHAQGRAAAVGNNIYVPGGFNSVQFGGPLDTMQIYSTTTNTWSMGMSLPAARSGVAAAAFNNLVYVIAGYNPVGTGHPEVYIYDPGTNSYTTGAPMPAGEGNVAGVLLGGEIYVVGGGTAPGAHYAYNPVPNAWRTIAALPTSGGTCQSDNGFVLDGELWIVGCLNLPINQQVWIYNSGTDTWRAGPPYSVDHQGPGAALFNARGFAVGGGAASGGSTAVESVGSCAPMASDAFSRKVHGGAGTFDIPLPLTGNVGVECRSGGATNDYQMIIDFATAVTVESASVTSGTGTVSSFSGSGTSQITVNLTGVTNVQRITMTLHNVNNGTTTGDVPISMGVLIGDVNGNAVVNASDVSLTKSQVGQTVSGSNFREDVNVNGTISATDVTLVKSKVGTALPP